MIPTSAAATGRPVDILLVEDNPGDVRLTREALRDSNFPNTLHVAGDGLQAMAYLHREAPLYATCPRPDLVLLDLNLPRKDGREVLQEMKADESLRRIPVIVLTTSRAERDVQQTYDLHANCYITKPVDLDQFITVVKSIENFWVSTVTLPTT